MIKAEIRGFIKGLLPAEDKTGKYHSNIVDAAIEKVLSEVYNEVYWRDSLELQRYTKGYGYTTALTVLYENATGLYYTTLPAGIIPFPDKASGVRRVSTVIKGGLTFFPVDQRETDFLLSGSIVDTVTEKIGYCVTPTRVEYYNMNGTVIGNGVRMDLIVPFSVYLDIDTVLIPEIGTPDGEKFVDRVLKVLGVIQPVDLKDDNADTVKQTDNGRQ